MTNYKNHSVHYTAKNPIDVVHRIGETRRNRRMFRRCETPALPSENTLYATAKKLEYDGDIAGALDLLYQAMQSGERVDSCMKDIAGLLNMMGRIGEAVNFLKANEDKVTNKVGYSNLLSRLENDLARIGSAHGTGCLPSNLPRGITIIVADESLGPVSVSLCDRLFPNPAKIRRILYTDESGFIATVHFASHSSARKALQVQKSFPDQVACNWANMYTEGLLRKLEIIERDQLEGSSIRYQEDHVPAHLGGGFIPIYKESDASVPRLTEAELEVIKQQTMEPAVPSPIAPVVVTSPVKSQSVSPISTVSTPRTRLTTTSEGQLSSPRSVMVLHEVLANHRELFSYSGISVDIPYVTTVGDGVSAMVIPFPTSEMGESEISKISVYAKALSSVASAMTTVATLLETQRRHGTTEMQTPVKSGGGRECRENMYCTPSPIILRNMFT